MIGVVIGVIFSVVVFTLMPRDPKAVAQFKQKKKAQEEKKLKAQKQQKQAIQKMKNDPQLKKRREQNDKKMREKLFDGLNESDRKLMQDYLASKKKDGKTDAQIIKDATSKAGFFMVFALFLIFVLIFALIIIVNGGDVDKLMNEGGKLLNEGQKLISAVYPKFGAVFNTTAPIVAQNVNKIIQNMTTQL